MSKKAMDDVDPRELVKDQLWRQEAEQEAVAGDEPVDIVVRRPPAHKDTKQWCKGHVGRPHQLGIEIPANAWRQDCRWVTNVGSRPWYSCQHVEHCLVCGKVIRAAYGWLTRPDPRKTLLSEECPDYRPLPT